MLVTVAAAGLAVAGAAVTVAAVRHSPPRPAARPVPSGLPDAGRLTPASWRASG